MFRVHQTSHLESRNLFFLIGEIVSGKVEPQMSLQILLSHELYWRKAITSIEYVDFTDESYLALGVRLGDEKVPNWLSSHFELPTLIEVV